MNSLFSSFNINKHVTLVNIDAHRFYLVALVYFYLKPK